MPSSFRSRLSLEGQEGTRVFVIDAQNKVDVAKVSGVDSYRGLRVLEAGLEAGQTVIVEGVQLVRQGQTVKPVAAPLEKFMTQEIAPLAGDSRFNSRLSRLPGRDAPAPKNSVEKAAREKPTPSAAEPEGPRPKAPAAEPKSQQPPTSSPAGKQPR